MDTQSPICRVTEHIIIGLFLALISLPLIGKLLSTESSFALTENRRPAPLPTIVLNAPGWGWSIVSFPRRFERYWNDSFAFRWYLIRWHSIAKLKMGVSPSSQALVGRDGYLFYAGERSLDYFRSVNPFSDGDLARWHDDLEARRTALEKRGVRYVVVVAPNKETIYPEFMPHSIRPVHKQTRLDQLLAYLHAHSDIDIVDLRQALRRAKQTEQVYYRTDTHWNNLGAYVAYGEILAQLNRYFIGDARALPGTTAVRTTAGGDLARILALEDRFTDESVDWIPAEPRRARQAEAYSIGSADVVVMECSGCAGPRAVMFHDSFNTLLAPFLAEYFRRIAFVDGAKLDFTLIDRERPDIVIQEFVERKLMCQSLTDC